MSRVCVVGLDSLAPDLLFGRYWQHLPNLRRLAAGGRSGRLQSCQPPITVPAWMAMCTGQDPGAMGVYGFADRADYGYRARRLASAATLQVPPVWQILAAAGHASCLVNIPQTYPPQRGCGRVLTGLLTPPERCPVTEPGALAAGARAILGPGPLDVDNFRQAAPAALVAAVRRNTRRLFRLARAWATGASWSLFMMVDMGADRLQHALWRWCVPDHPAHEAGHPQAAALRDYYRLLDQEIGRLLGCLAPDDLVLVVSDHGAQAMRGALALNTWLQDIGYLRLRGRAPRVPTAWDPEAVDWERTRAWADGGYVGRVHLNICGREPQGSLSPTAVPAALAELERELTALPGGPHVAVRPDRVFARCRGIPPALWVHAAGLARRCLASLGHPGVLVADNDRGPDAANHARDGIFIRGRAASRAHRGDATPGGGRASIYDIAPTVLEHLGVDVPPALTGSPLA